MNSAKFAHWLDVPTWTWPSNFHPVTDPKLVDPLEGSIIVNLEQLYKLQALRGILDAPVKLLSGYRGSVYNARVGGSPRSQHLQGKAHDIATEPFGLLTVERVAREVGFTGFGYYPSRKFIHLDTGRPRHWFGSKLDKRLYEELKINPDIEL